MSKSIYQILCDNIKDGILDPAFTLDSSSDPEKLKWAPGAWDGILMYHMGAEKMDAAAAKIMAQALKAAAHQKFEKADDLFLLSVKSTAPFP